jgi:hypothetical protein
MFKWCPLRNGTLRRSGHVRDPTIWTYIRKLKVTSLVDYKTMGSFIKEDEMGLKTLILQS